jgi:Ser-tRNA(Ala) deacylase AlaX
MNDFNPNRKEYDPRMHSAEHILNQTMIRMFNCGRAFSAHIEKKKSKCDYRFDRDLTPDEIAAIEKTVNDIIGLDLPIKECFLSRAEAARRVTLTKLPEDAGETIRVVTIGDYDACPCSGPHTSSTRAIGTFKIASTAFENAVLRIRFKLAELDSLNPALGEGT